MRLRGLGTTKLRRAKRLDISIVGDRVTLRTDVAEFTGTDLLLELIAAFSYPKTLAEGLARVRGACRSKLDWIQTSATLVRLVDVGILEAIDREQPHVSAFGSGFHSARAHVSMLDDRVRTQAYVNAIRATVKPGDVVVDLGTGTGVLAATAALCGARRVYAIEATGIADVARALFAANALEDRVSLIKGVSTAVELPERADVLMSELIGSEPFAERVLEYTRDAIRRFVKPDARVIPARLRVFAEAIELPRDVIARQAFTVESTSQWSSWYDLDFRELARATTALPYRFSCRPPEAVDWSRLSDPIELASLDLRHVDSEGLDVRRTVKVTAPGSITGVLVHFELEIGDGECISTNPRVASERCSWNCPIWLVQPSLEVRPGDEIELSYRYSFATTALTCRRAPSCAGCA